MPRFWFLLAVGLGCGSGAQSPPSSDGTAGSGQSAYDSCASTPRAPVSAVAVTDTGFAPACAYVNFGGSITFTNTGHQLHSTLTETEQADSFDSGPLTAGASYRHTFQVEGAVRLRCLYHPEERLFVVVK